ncbi:YidC/Oxa1 family membrane protein insertase, partial [Phenoliferia sp. Uapishka_3]
MAVPRIGARALRLSVPSCSKLAWIPPPPSKLSSHSFPTAALSQTFSRRVDSRALWTAGSRACASGSGMHRRAFSSTPSIAALSPLTKEAPPTAERHFDDAALAAPSAPSFPPSDVPPIEDLTTSVSDASPTSHFLTTANDALISTGTLDLTSLATTWGPHPIMRLQSLFLQLHESFPGFGYMPWYILIPVITLFVRLLLFGFQVRSQANAARMAIIQPRMLAGMEKVKAAKALGDVNGQQEAMVAVQKLMQENNVNPIRGLAFPLAQGAVFMSMFFALKGLAGADITSLTTEGFGWVKDLTARDPYWALPLTSTALTMATLEFGMDTNAAQTPNMGTMRVAFRVLLVICLPFVAQFPAILLMYWTVNNFISLCQSQFLKLPAVRSFFNIPTPPPKPQPGQPGYIAEPGFAEAFRNVQVGFQETKQKAADAVAAEEARVRNLKEAEAVVVPKAEPESVYVPRAPMPKKKGVVEETVEKISGRSQPKGEIVAERRERGAAEEKARRVLQARQRRK